MEHILIRSIRPDENPQEGLFARDVNANITAEMHVASGKKASQWISTTRSLAVMLKYYFMPEKKNKTPKDGIVIIDRDKIDMQIEDVSYRGVDWVDCDADTGEISPNTGANFARAAQEELILRHVPKEAILLSISKDEIEAAKRRVPTELEKTHLQFAIDRYNKERAPEDHMYCRPTSFIQGWSRINRLWQETNETRKYKIALNDWCADNNEPSPTKGYQEYQENMSCFNELLDSVGLQMIKDGNLQEAKYLMLSIISYTENMTKIAEQTLGKKRSNMFKYQLPAVEYSYAPVHEKETVAQPDTVPVQTADEAKKEADAFFNQKAAKHKERYEIHICQDGSIAILGEQQWLKLIQATLGGDIYNEAGTRMICSNASKDQIQTIIRDITTVEKMLTTAIEKMVAEKTPETRREYNFAQSIYQKLWAPIAERNRELEVVKA